MANHGETDNWELYGLALTAFGVQFSVVANSLSKTVNTMPVVQAMQLRFLIQWCCTFGISIVLRLRGKPIHLLGRPEHRRLLTARALFSAVAMMSSWTALRLIPVGDSTTIVYFYPIICGLIANKFLNEPLGWSFWSQAGICFVGVMLVTGAAFTQASAPSYQQGVAFALLAACCYASTNCCVRALKDAQTFEVQLFTDTLMAFLVMPLTLMITGNASDWSGWSSAMFLRLTGATAFGLCALLQVVLGHQLAPASKATLFTYLEVPSAFAVQIFAFGEMPGLQKALGGSLIVVAAAVRFWFEASRNKMASQTPLLTEQE